MDDRIKHIIESGLLDSYLLGLTDAKLTEEIDMLLENSEVLRNSFSELEDLQYNLSSSVAVDPPQELKVKVKKAISDVEKSASTKVEPTPKKSASTYKTYAAGILALGLAIVSILQFQNNRKLKEEISDLKSKHQEQRIEFDALKLKADNLELDLLFMNNPATEKIILDGNAKAPDLKIVAFWNDELQSSKLMIENLPELKNKKCFQMWADVEGEMKNLGIIAASEGKYDWQFLQNAESLNITIEPEGGSDHPTVSDLVASSRIGA